MSCCATCFGSSVRPHSCSVFCFCLCLTEVEFEGFSSPKSIHIPLNKVYPNFSLKIHFFYFLYPLASHSLDLFFFFSFITQSFSTPFKYFSFFLYIIEIKHNNRNPNNTFKIKTWIHVSEKNKQSFREEEQNKSKFCGSMCHRLLNGNSYP
jgi:hypothetical protein